MQKKMLDNLLEEFKTVQKKFGLPIGDFPHLGKFRDTIKLFEIHKFPPLDQKRLDVSVIIINQDIIYICGNYSLFVVVLLL